MIERIPITDREQWMALRRQDVTASDIAAVCGVSPFKTALRLWAEKAGDIPEVAETGAMKRGRHLEDAVLNYFREDDPSASVTKPGVYLRDADARIGATPDAIAAMEGEEVVVQCKVVNKLSFDRDWEDGVPLHYQLQVLTECMLWGAARGILAALVIDTFGSELHTFNIPRHAQAEARIREAVSQFWADVSEGKQPRADYSRDGELLQMLYLPKDSAPPLDLSTDNFLPEILDERARLTSEIKERNARLDAIKCEVIEKMGVATFAALPGWKITHKVQHRAAYTVQANSFPVLRITKTGDSNDAIRSSRNSRNGFTADRPQQGPF